MNGTYSKRIKGFNVSETQKGYVVVRIHYSADPAKRGEGWKAKAKKEMPDAQSWQREYEIDWSATTGKPFYPSFSQRYVTDKAHFMRKMPIIKNQPVYRGWDFGFNLPACVWFQISTTGRVGVHREVMPEKIDVHSYVMVVKYLSGQVSYESKALQRREKALYALDKLQTQVGMGLLPEMPWFEKGTRFEDFSGPEALRTGTIESDKGETKDAEVLAGMGIELTMLPQSVHAGERIIRRLLHPHPDGKGPSLIISPYCHTLILGLAGGVTFSKGTKKEPLSDKANKDGFYEHLHDALRYGLVGVMPILEDFRGAPPEEQDDEELPVAPESMVRRSWDDEIEDEEEGDPDSYVSDDDDDLYS